MVNEISEYCKLKNYRAFIIVCKVTRKYEDLFMIDNWGNDWLDLKEEDYNEEDAHDNRLFN